MAEMVQFRCPCPEANKFSCPVDRTGKPAKCPKCEKRFRVPTLDEIKASESGAKSRILDTQQLSFKCAQCGELLHGPPNLAGRAGKCPNCDSKFRIPPLEAFADGTVPPTVPFEAPPADQPIDQPTEEAYELGEYQDVEVVDQPVEGEDMELGEIEPESYAPQDNLDEIETIEEGPYADDAGYHDPGYQDPGYHEEYGHDPYGQEVEPELIDEASMHPLALVFTRLWQQRDDGVKLEVHLEGGVVIKADSFAPQLSHGPHGVFASRDEDGRYSLTTLVWDSVQRIVLRGVDELPEEMFD